jgi:hypothetical protein
VNTCARFGSKLAQALPHAWSYGVLSSGAPLPSSSTAASGGGVFPAPSATAMAEHKRVVYRLFQTLLKQPAVVVSVSAPDPKYVVLCDLVYGV